MTESKTRDTRFTALKTFNCEFTDNVYVEGLSYLIRKDNEVLRNRAMKWRKDGKIRIEMSPGAKGRIRGNGELK